MLQFLTSLSQNGWPCTWHVGGELKEAGLGRGAAALLAALGVPWEAAIVALWGLLAAVP